MPAEPVRSAASGERGEPGEPREPGPSAAEAGADREPGSAERRDTAWDEDVLPYFTEDEAQAAALAAALADRGAPAPVSGYELGDSGWMVELAWPTRRITVVLELGAAHGESDRDGDDEAHRRDAAYRSAGWQVRTSADWHDHLDSLIALLDAAPGSSSPTDDSEGAPR